MDEVSSLFKNKFMTTCMVVALGDVIYIESRRHGSDLWLFSTKSKLPG